ncbi:MAG: ATP-dependent zinc metalloprotease FtsH [Spirochaetaceae bacterium]|jgi:cell division protease FtsH|nr:ATP-dependent zinc metalloprotease FtsH [Spirochaetaceae bacterium]
MNNDKQGGFFNFGGPGGPKLPDPKKMGGGWKFSVVYVIVLFFGIGLFNYIFTNNVNPPIPYSEFKQKIESGEIIRVEMNDSFFIGYTNKNPAQNIFKIPQNLRYTSPGNYYRAVPLNDPALIALLDAKKVEYFAVSREGNAIFGFFFTWILPILFFFMIWRFVMKRMGGAMGGVLSIGQNRAVIVAEGDVKTRFADVAGVDEAKDELVEVVDFLKSPKKYTEIGGKIPKGVLLVGPPGTGKTLLARAVAGEAGVCFFRMSGADFVEMFVGVGAARVRDLFKQAREKAPCIIFIDELDAIGKSRFNNFSGNDEREQTLNQLLVEMDGFDASSGLIILAATNRPDVLDAALLRPGRFDRQVLVDRPDLSGREAILKIHSKDVKLDASVDLELVARGTSGFAGADLANIVNEAALLAVRAGRRLVSQPDFNEAIEKVAIGLQKKTRVLKPEERRLTAYHEAGHALVTANTPNADPVTKISIIPRGFALGYTRQMPLEDRYTITQSDLLGQIDILLGGRIAEEMISGEYSTGAANDLTRATDIARKMITDYGMSERFRNVALTSRSAGSLGTEDHHEPMFQREYAESTQQYVDEEIARIVESRFAKTKNTLDNLRETLDRVAAALLEKETLDEKEFKALLQTSALGQC